MSEVRFALVLLEEDSLAAVGELAGGLAGLLGRVPFDVASALRRNPQVPFEDLSEAQAAEAVRLLADAGTRAVALPAGKLGPFPPICWVHQLAFDAAGLSVQTDYVGTVRELPWAGLAAVSAATLSTTETPLQKGPSIAGELARTATAVAGLSLGIPGMGLRLRSPKAASPAPRVEVFQVLAVAPFDAAVEIRFRDSTLNYSCLGERMTSSSAQNFRLLAQYLVQGAARARVSPAARALAESGAPPRKVAPEAFRSYNRWLAFLAREGLT